MEKLYKTNTAYFAYAYMMEGDLFGENLHKPWGPSIGFEEKVKYTKKPYFTNGDSCGTWEQYGFQEAIEGFVSHDLKCVVYKSLYDMRVGKGGFKTQEGANEARALYESGYKILSISTDFFAGSLVTEVESKTKY
jgi:hypothetical protein